MKNPYNYLKRYRKDLLQIRHPITISTKHKRTSSNWWKASTETPQLLYWKMWMSPLTTPVQYKTRGSQIAQLTERKQKEWHCLLRKSRRFYPRVAWTNKWILIESQGTRSVLKNQPQFYGLAIVGSWNVNEQYHFQ